MLSTRFPARRAFVSALLAAGALALAGCATGRLAGTDGIAVDPGQPVRVALLVPYGSGDPGRDAIARSLENAARLAQTDLRDATIDLAVYPSAGTTAGGAAAAQQAIAEGAKIIVGPLFSTETAGAQGPAGSAGLTVLSLSNNPAVAGGNVFILGTSFENTAARLVAFGQSRGMRSFGVVYPAGLEGETARDAVATVVNGRGATLVASQPYNLSVEGIQAAAGPAAAALLSGGAQAVILTDGPTGGLGFISEALRNNGVSPTRRSSWACSSGTPRPRRWRCRACRAGCSPPPTRASSPPSRAATAPPTARRRTSSPASPSTASTRSGR